MEIKTKFNLGDKVWTLKNFRATEIEVSGYEINSVGKLRVRDAGFYLYNEDECFVSKEELVNYIVNNDDEDL